MGTRRKKSSKKATDKAKKQDSKVTFKAFFSRCIILGKVKPWQENEIYAFFKTQNLKDKEDLDIYEEMLKKY